VGHVEVVCTAIATLHSGEIMFVEIATGSVKNRNIIIPIEQLKQKIVDARDKNEELYRSYYLFDNEVLEHFKVRKTVKNYKGKYYLKEIVLDIDKGDKTDEVTLIRAREFAKSLNEDWNMSEEHFKIFYSGRGYHFHIADYFGFEASNFLPLEVKATIAKVFPEADTMPLMPTGLIRMAHTINQKVQRYKIRLSFDELNQLSIEEIMLLATKGNINRVEYSRGDYDFSKYKVTETYKKKEAIEASKPSGIVTCIQNLYNKGPVKGSRHDTMLRLISSWSRSGVPELGVKNMLLSWSPDMEPAEINKMVNDTYKKQYQYGCMDPLLKENCDPKCIYYKNKNYSLDIVSAKDMEKNFVNFIRSDFKARSFDFNDIVPIKNKFMVYPGEFVIIIGDTKIGKTALAQNMILKLKHLPIDYLCLEINERLLFRRNIQIEHRMTKNQVFDHYEVNENSLRKGTNHIDVMTVSPDLFRLKKIISERNRPITVIDTLDRIDVGKLGNFRTSEAKLANGIREICQQLDTIIIGVHHIPKYQIQDGQGKRKKLTLHSGKGDSGLEQQADKIIAIEGEQGSEYREISALGARDESLFKFSCKFERDTFRLIKIADLKTD
jgi:hypothetical protein